ncbi:hypothetical protein [Lysobacter antibioticus]|nr:hypothetical protein [Lysobacter antibioticus]
MKLAVFPVSVSDNPRATTLTRAWIERACASVKRYIEEQSGGRKSPDFKVFDWLALSMTRQQWMALGGNVSDTVNQEVISVLQADLSGYDRFIYIIDDGVSTSGVSENNEIRIGALDFDPALLAHELTHVYGAGDTFLDAPDGPKIYDALFCIMGREGSKHSFRDMSLVSPHDGADIGHADCGPGMCVPTLLATGWLDLAKHGVEVTGFTTGLTGSTARIRALDGAPREDGGLPVCCFVDDGDRYLVEYRSPKSRWDGGLPASANGWLVVNRTPLDGPLTTLEVASFAVMPGKTVSFGGPDNMYPFGAGPLRLSVMACDVTNGTVDVRFARQLGKAPQYTQPFEGFIPDDGCLLWTPTSGWRSFPARSDLALVLEKVVELDQIRDLARVSGRRYAMNLAGASERQHVALQEAVAQIDNNMQTPKGKLMAQTGRLRQLLHPNNSMLDRRALTEELENLQSIVQQVQ